MKEKQRLEMLRSRFRNAAFPLLHRRMAVHTNDRDQRTKAAIELFS